MKRPLAFGAMLACFAPALYGTSGDFARGAAVEVSPDGAAYRLTIPEDVYAWTTRDDLGDVRVLNGAGEELPYSLRIAPGGDAVSEWAALPMFALPLAKAGNGATSVNIELGKDGAVVAVQGAAPRTEAGGYLVDASKYRRPVDGVRVVWDAAQDDVLAIATLLASDDLTTWREVARPTTLASLRAGGASVELDKIEVNGARAKYLKLELDRSLAVTEVRVRTLDTTPPPRAVRTLAATAVENGFEFETNGRFPVDRVAVELDEPTYLLDATIFSRPTNDARWRELGTRSFYRASTGAIAATSDPMSLTTTRDRYWRVVPSSRLPETPRLRIEWVPHEVVFLVQGAPPYVLVYGHGGIAAREWPVGELLTRTGQNVDLAALPVAMVAAPVTLGGEARLVPPAAPIDWRSIVLWGVLVLGVGVVAGLALRLIRQSKSVPPANP